MSKETITSETYQKALNAHSEEWGKAYLTGFEQELLFEEHRQFMQRYSIDSNSAWYLLKDHLNRGNFPQFESVSAAQFIEAAISHGCPVALSLYEERSDPALITRSYLTKNRAYRMIKRVLRENNNPLLSQWIGAEIKAYKHDGVARLVRPAKLGLSTLQGIERVQIYWPCQLLRVLDGLVQGWDPVPEFVEVDPIKFQISWHEYQSGITEATTLEELAINIATCVVNTLREHQVSSSVIAKLLAKGYSPVGPLNEHGQVDKIKHTWQGLLQQLATDPKNTQLCSELSSIVFKKIDNWTPPSKSVKEAIAKLK